MSLSCENVQAKLLNICVKAQFALTNWAFFVIILRREGVVGAAFAGLDRHTGETPVQTEMTRLLQAGSVSFFADFCAGQWKDD